MDQAAAHAEIRVPECGGTAIRFVGWLVEDGEHVTSGERIGELLSEGVLIEFNASATGVLQQQPLAALGEVQPGQLLATIARDTGAEVE